MRGFTEIYLPIPVADKSLWSYIPGTQYITINSYIDQDLGRVAIYCSVQQARCGFIS